MKLFTSLQPVGHPLTLEGILVDLDPRQGRQKQRDIAEAGRAGRTVAGMDRPTLINHPADEGGNTGGLRFPKRLGVHLLRIERRRRRQQHDTGLRPRCAEGVKMDITRLVATCRGGLDQSRKNLVDPGHDSRDSAKVLGNGEHVPTGEQTSLRLFIYLDVRPAEPVYGLLRISDDQKLPRSRQSLVPPGRPGLTFGQEEDDLGLEGVGILELVHQEVAEPALEVGANLGVVAQEVPGLDQEVVEAEHPPPLLLLAEAAKEPAEPSDEAGDDIRPDEIGYSTMSLGKVAAERLLFTACPSRPPVPLVALLFDPYLPQNVPFLVFRGEPRQPLSVYGQLSDMYEAFITPAHATRFGQVFQPGDPIAETGDKVRAGAGVRARAGAGARAGIRARAGDHPPCHVPMPHEFPGKIGQMPDLQAEAERPPQGRRSSRQLVLKPTFPDLSDEKALGQIVDNLESRVHPGLDRAFPQ